ncbi:MAG: GxxExxY protein [Bacteroidetes bacterium]|nr:GxxExxY protein [Bacteroidota bacterium]
MSQKENIEIEKVLNKQFLDDVTYEVIGAAIEVHKTMGPGLLESIYHQCMIEELSGRKMNFSTEIKIPVLYKTRILNMEFRCDLFVENCLVVELKAVNEMNTLFDAQLLTYMKLLKAPKGLLLNFNCSNIFSNGQKTLVNEYFRDLK